MIAIDTGMVFACGAGAALGAIHFWGLWSTVRLLVDTTRPVSVAVLSFFLRVSVSALGLLLLALAGGWLWLAPGLLGFFGARWLIVRRVRHASATTEPSR